MDSLLISFELFIPYLLNYYQQLICKCMSLILVLFLIAYDIYFNIFIFFSQANRKADNGPVSNAPGQQQYWDVKSPKRPAVQQPRALPPRPERGQNAGSRNAADGGK